MRANGLDALKRGDLQMAETYAWIANDYYVAVLGEPAWTPRPGWDAWVDELPKGRGGRIGGDDG